jgi:integrase/recombinase XerD
MEKYIVEYTAFLETNHYALSSRIILKGMLGSFDRWVKEEHVENPADITAGMLFSYQEYLKEKIDQYGKKESIKSQRQKLSTVKGFLEYLKDRGLILTNPAGNLKLPRLHRRIPGEILTKEQINLVLSKPDVMTPLGLRDRAMLELFYATGMRRMEVCHLRLGHIDFKEKTIEIRNSKAAKDRLIPVSHRALGWLNKYLADARPKLISEKSADFVFLNYLKMPFALDSFGDVFKKYFTACGLSMRCCHVFRHTFATQMLEAGVDLRLIQEMLGHTKLDTTQIYTRVSIRKLQEVHARTHPARPTGMSKRHLEEKLGVDSG